MLIELACSFASECYQNSDYDVAKKLLNDKKYPGELEGGPTMIPTDKFCHISITEI